MGSGRIKCVRESGVPSSVFTGCVCVCLVPPENSSERTSLRFPSQRGLGIIHTIIRDGCTHIHVTGDEFGNRRWFPSSLGNLIFPPYFRFSKQKIFAFHFLDSLMLHREAGSGIRWLSFPTAITFFFLLSLCSCGRISFFSDSWIHSHNTVTVIHAHMILGIWRRKNTPSVALFFLPFRIQFVQGKSDFALRASFLFPFYRHTPNLYIRGSKQMSVVMYARAVLFIHLHVRVCEWLI